MYVFRKMGRFVVTCLFFVIGKFDCLLMLFPDEVIDSVVVHELCHRKHMNHSTEFYKEVEKAFPRYRSCQKWLKEHGGMYLTRLR